MLLTDTHCHLNHERFKQDFEDVFERARSADVRRLLVVGFDLDSSRRAVELSQTYPEIEAVIGIHPEDARSGSAAVYAELRALASAPTGRVVAWGEIGLDYYWQDVPQPIQRGCFEAQLGISQTLGLPVVIHCRNAYTDVLDILAGYPKLRAELHCFTGNADEAARAVGQGYYVGAGGILTFKKSQALRETFAGVPLERILTETDSPYLAPQPYRGKRNEPAFVAYVIHTLAEIFQVTPAEIAYETSKNADKFFGKPRPMARP